MKPTLRTIITVWILLILALIFTGCNPVKQVLKSDSKTQLVIDSYLKKHPYTNDTSVIYLPGRTDSVPVYLKYTDTIDNTVPCDSFTRVTDKGTTVTVNKQGKLTVKNDSLKSYTYLKTDTLQTLIRDRQLLTEAQDLIRRQAADLISLEHQLELKKAKLSNLKLKLSLLTILLIASVGWSVYRIFK